VDLLPGVDDDSEGIVCRGLTAATRDDAHQERYEDDRAHVESLPFGICKSIVIEGGNRCPQSIASRYGTQRQGSLAEHANSLTQCAKKPQPLGSGAAFPVRFRPNKCGDDEPVASNKGEMDETIRGEDSYAN
jgi:hypothetical protein